MATCGSGEADGAMRLLTAIRAARRDGEADAERRCVHCGEHTVWRWGSFSGRQRYRCRSCGRTFSDLTATPLAYNRRLGSWLEFLELAGRPARGEPALPACETAARLGIHRQTSLRWTHRLLASLAATPQPRLAGEVRVAHTFFAVSDKGQPLYDGRTRGGLYSPGVRLTWLLVAVSGDGRIACASTDPRGTIPAVRRALDACIAPDSTLIGVASYRSTLALAAKDAGMPYTQVYPGHPAAEGADRDNARSAHSYAAALRRWLHPFRGVATDWLFGYIAWHTLSERCRLDPGASWLAECLRSLHGGRGVSPSSDADG
jgi:transposase-like protein